MFYSDLIDPMKGNPPGPPLPDRKKRKEKSLCNGNLSHVTRVTPGDKKKGLPQNPDNTRGTETSDLVYLVWPGKKEIRTKKRLHRLVGWLVGKYMLTSSGPVTFVCVCVQSQVGW